MTDKWELTAEHTKKSLVDVALRAALSLEERIALLEEEVFKKKKPKDRALQDAIDFEQKL